MGRPISLEELAKLTGSTLFGDGKEMVFSLSDLDTAKKGQVSFLANLKYKNAFSSTKASAVFVHPSFLEEIKAPYPAALLVNENPSLAFQKIIDIILTDGEYKTGFEGIHPTAVVHPTAKIGKGVTLSPYVVVDREVVIKDNVTISSFCYIGPYSEIGENSFLHPHVVLREKSLLGKEVILQPGAVIGSCGFGYVQTREGKHQKLNQLGHVEIKDRVEIGANTTLDRGRFQPTVISSGTKIDNLVQIAHAVHIGEDNIIVAQSGFAGSTKTGRFCMFGGQSAIGGHLVLGDQIKIAAKSGVTKSILEKGSYGGFPAYKLDQHNRDSVLARRLSSLFERVKNVENGLLSKLTLVEKIDDF